MIKSKETFVNCIKNFVLGIFFILILLLFLFSITETSTINIDEIISWEKDSPLLHIFFLLCICLAVTFLPKYIHLHISPKILSAIFFMGMLFLIFATQLYPKADQLQIMILCTHIAEGNYQDFLPGGYLYNQPHQIFLTYFSAILYSFLGESYIYLFQILNAMAILGTYYILLKIYKRFDTTHSSLAFYIVSFLFVPYAFYVTFLYGTAIGLFLAIAACEQFLKYMEVKSSRSMINCTVLILLAYLFKSNFLIFLLGFLAVLVFDFLKKINFRHILFGCILVCSLVLCNHSMTAFTEHLTGIHSDGGVPKILFIAMGLQESNLAPGWWTGYHDKIFLENNFDVEASKEAGEKRIQKRLKQMKKDPHYGVSFFLKKLSSEWSEPTYESIWIQQHRESMTDIPDLIDRLIHNGGRLADLYVFYCNLFQSFLYFGTLLFVIGYWNKFSSEQLLIPAIFIGGFLFHTLWEAKGQYTLPYCVCLLPCCVRGYEFVAQKLSNARINCSRLKLLTFVGMLCLFLMGALLFRELFFCLIQ